MPAPTASVSPVRQAPRRDPIDVLWNLFCSVKFAVVLNIALALAAMLGTFIPQMQPGIDQFAGEVDRFMTDAEARYGPLTGVLNWAGFFDIFNSLWFRMLVVIVVFSIVICTSNRWQPTLRLITKPMLRASDSFLDALSEKAEFRSVPLDTVAAGDALTSALRKGRYRVLAAHDPDGQTLHLYADRDRWSKMVTFVSHAALVLLILTAAGFTQVGWRERSVFFAPGQPVNVGHGLDFSVMNTGFDIEYYADGKSVKEYKNTLAVIEDGQTVLTKTIIVNSPLRYKDTNFFLVSYQPVLFVKAAGPGGETVPMKQMGASGPVTTTANTSGEALYSMQLVSNENLPMDIAQVSAGEHFLTMQMTYYQDVTRAAGENPPVYVQAYLDRDFEKPVFDGFIPRTGTFSVPGYEQYAFTFRGDTATVLEVASDPGLGLVGFWFAIMTLGFTLSLYTTFTRCWAKIAPNEAQPGTLNITIGGLAEKNKVTFERDFEKLAGRISSALATATAGRGRAETATAATSQRLLEE